MFAGQQFLSELVTSLVGVFPRAGEVIFNPRSRRTAEIIHQRQDFVRGLAVIDFVLRKRTTRADCKKLRGNSDEA